MSEPKPTLPNIEPVENSEQSREQIQEIITTACKHNQEMLRSGGNEVSDDERWDNLFRLGKRFNISVRNPEGNSTTQPDIYITEDEGETVVCEYCEYPDDDGPPTPGQSFSIQKDRIISIKE